MPQESYAHAMAIRSLGEGGKDLQERASKGLTIQQQDWLAQIFSQFLEEPEREALTDVGNTPEITVISYCGDGGKAAGQSFAAALWLVEHAGVFLRGIQNVNHGTSIERPEDIASTIVTALTDEIGLPREERMKLLAHLLIDLGCSMGNVSQAWQSPTRQQLDQFVDQAAYSLSGTGFQPSRVFLLLPSAPSTWSVTSHDRFRRRSHSKFRLVFRVLFGDRAE
jgi:hypothetical protein